MGNDNEKEHESENEGRKYEMKIKVYGKVKGVGFRHGLKEQADHLELFGECHNSVDGSVSCTVQGGKHEIEEILRWAHHGPQLAKVESVESHWQQIKEEHHHFTIR